MIITAHWIDNEWNLPKKFFNFFQTPYDKCETIAKGVETCFVDCGVENLFTVNLDDVDVAIKHLKWRINDWKVSSWEMIFYIVRCNAHILNLIIKEGLSEQNESISRVKIIVKFVSLFL